MYKKIIFALLFMFLFFNVNVKAADVSDWYFISQINGRASQPDGYVQTTDNIQNWRYVSVGTVYQNRLTYFDLKYYTSPGGVPNDAVGKYRVVTTYCSSSNSGIYMTNYANLDSVTVINRELEVTNGQCVVTAPNGTVLNGYRLKLAVDFSINTAGGFHTISQRIVFDSQVDIKMAIMDIDITNPVQYSNYENTQDIINNQNSNTSDITSAIGGMSSDIQNKIQSQINNDNTNTQSIINNNNSNTQSIINSNNQVNNSVNNLNNNINSTNTSGSETALSGIINDPAFQDNTGINSIVTLPLNMINSLSNTCTPISLTIPYLNSNVTLPCYRAIITNYMPLVAALITLVINGFVLYRVLLDIVGIVKAARNPDDDRIEVLDL